MKYISEIKAFYDRLELNPLPSPAIALWHALMSIANKTGWQQEFTVAVSVLMLKSGLNAQAIKRARNRLEQDGYITWKSRGGNQSASYHINSLVVQNDIENVPQFVPQSVPQSVPQFVPQSVPINRHRLDKTIITPISPLQKFEEFYSAYPLDINRSAAERAYASVMKDGIFSEDDLVIAAKNYSEYCKITSTDKMYHANNFLSKAVFEDFLPGKYKKPTPSKKENASNQFKQHDYNFDSLEKELLKIR